MISTSIEIFNTYSKLNTYIVDSDTENEHIESDLNTFEGWISDVNNNSMFSFINKLFSLKLGTVSIKRINNNQIIITSKSDDIKKICFKYNNNDDDNEEKKLNIIIFDGDNLKFLYIKIQIKNLNCKNQILTKSNG